MNSEIIHHRSYSLGKEQIPPVVVERLDDIERINLKEKIKKKLVERDAVIVSHYYTDSDLQLLTDETGGCVSDSLEMARFGYETEAKNLIVCGVKFMGETAKILNPEKQIFMPDLGANCSLDIGCPVDEFSKFCDAHPDHVVVVYANTSAAVKARADWMVTSGSAVDVIKYLNANNKKIIWAPDKYLGDYVQKQSGANMLIWQGSCVVHEEFKGKELETLRENHPDAKVLVHPESPSSVISQADMVGSTTAIIKAVGKMDAKKFIVATDKGIFHKIREVAKNKILIEAPTAGKGATCISCAHCPWMAMNSLKKLLHILETGENEIFVEKDIIDQAKGSIEKLLKFTCNNKRTSLANDA
tara:strand:+ start:3103 stop:4176 length:1074 start_codon:yes stop_codon:yes gene_type:complete